jgi:hypothetical protein
VTSEYDAETGNYTDDIVETMKRASVTDSGVETMHLIYGGIHQGSKTIRLQNHYHAPFDSIRIGLKRYNVDFSRKLDKKHIFVVSEVQ